MSQALMWVRFAWLMALPAVGTLMAMAVSPGDKLPRVLLMFLVGIAPVILYLGFGAGIFAFPRSVGKALAVTFVTPLLLVLTTVILGWGPAYFFVDECFAEIGGMAFGAAFGALVTGGGGVGVRMVGAMFFGGCGVAALYLYGQPMVADRGFDPIWIGLNVLAIAWSTLVHFQVFKRYGDQQAKHEAATGRERAAMAAAASAPDPHWLEPGKTAKTLFVVLAIFGWLASIPVGAFFMPSSGSSKASESSRDRSPDPAPRRRRGRRRRRR